MPTKTKTTAPGNSPSIELRPPPLCAPGPGYEEGEPLNIVLADGQRHQGGLLAFKVNEALITARIEGRNGVEITDLPMRALKLLQLPKQRKMLRIARPLGAGTQGVVMPARKQEFQIEFSDGARMSGETFSFRLDRNGLHLYPSTKGVLYSHLFAPASAIKHYRIGPLLGNALVKQKLVTAADLETALHAQTKQRQQPLGEYLQSMAVVTNAQLEQALARQKHMPHLRIGDLLLLEDLITQSQLEDALRAQAANRRMPLGRILVGMGVVSEAAIKETLAKKLGVPFIDLRRFRIESGVLRLVPENVARTFRVLPLYLHKDRLIVAMEEPMHPESVEAIRLCAGMEVEVVTATVSDIAWAIERYYATGGKGRPTARAKR